ncbi:MAG: hypothetical protein U0414_38490 [Polyangiaceae bacterium]
MDPRPRPLPLSCRLPNRPALFVGRAAEIASLRQAIPSAPVTVVAGTGGLGKSALTLVVLHELFRERVGSTLFVSLRGSDPAEPLALAIVRTLVRAGDDGGLDWSELIGSPDALTTLAIDLADARGAWVVLDDLHHGDPKEVGLLLSHLARYARSSRWIITTRTAPRAEELAGQVLELAPMPDAELGELARALSPGSTAEAIARTVEGAAGSPWALRQGSAAPRGVGPLTPEDLARGVSPETLAFLSALTLVSVPVPESLLTSAAPRPTETLDALEARALVERTAEGVRLHELTRTLVPSPDRSAASQRLLERLGMALGRSPEAPPRLEAVRLLVEAGAASSAAELLDGAGAELLRAGYAAALWAMLEPRAPSSDAWCARTLERWRLRCAAQLGDAHVLARVRPPEGDDPEQQFLWAKLLLMKGELGRALVIAEGAELAAARAGDEALACDAGVLRARAAGNLGDRQGALAIVEALAPPDPLRRAQTDALRTVLLVHVGRPDDALRCATALTPTLPRLPWPARAEIGQRLVISLYHLGRLREAAEAFDVTVAGEQRGSVRFDVGRMLRQARGFVAIDSGDLERARRELDAVEPYLGHGSLLRDFVLCARAVMALVAGDLDELERRCADLEGRAIPPQVAHDIAATRPRGARARARRAAGRARAPARGSHRRGEPAPRPHAALAPRRRPRSTGGDRRRPRARLGARVAHHLARHHLRGAPPRGRRGGRDPRGDARHRARGGARLPGARSGGAAGPL